MADAENAVLQTARPLSATARLSEQKWELLRTNVIGSDCKETQDKSGFTWLIGWRDAFNRPLLKDLLDLKRQINNAESGWIRYFLEHNGVERLLNAFQSLCEQRVLSLTDTLLQLSCVACIRSVMNSRTGLEYIIENKEFVSKFAFALQNCEQSVKQQIYALLSSLCLYSDDGHKRVLQILQTYKETKKKHHKFSLLLDDLQKCDTPSQKSALLALLNCIINGEKNLEERVRVRNELMGLQLASIIDQLRKDAEQDTDLSIQIDVFDERKSTDEEQLPGIEGLDLTSHSDVFNSIYKQVITKSYAIPFLAILQHLLQISTNETSKTESVWDTVEKLVFRAASISKNDDPEELLQTGTKRLERSTSKPACSCSCGQTDDKFTAARKQRLSTVLHSPLAIHRSLPSVWPGTNMTTVDIPIDATTSASDLSGSNLDEVDFTIEKSRSASMNNNSALTNGHCSVSMRSPTSVSSMMNGARTPVVPPPPPPPLLGISPIPGPPAPPPLPGVPAPPAPPIAPPFGVPSHPPNAISQLPLPQIPKPKSKMRTLQWGKITAQKVSAGQNVWSDLASQSSGDNGHGLDFDKISELFAVPQQQAKRTSIKDSCDSMEKKKKEEILLLDGKRSLNVNIFLRQFRRPCEELLSLIQAGRSEEIGAEKLLGLLRVLPELDEIELLRSFDGDERKLGSAEKFLVPLINIDEYKLRIEAMLLREEFPQKMDHIKPSIDAVILTARDMIESRDIKEIFLMILMAGNFINSGSYAGNAAGFKLSALLKLSEVRANVPRMNLLHYLLQELEVHRPDLLGFHQKMKFLEEASQCSVDNINSEIKSLKQRTQKICGKIHKTDPQFREALDEFLKFAETELHELELDMEEVEVQRANVAEYLCEDVKMFNLEDSFRTLHTFCQRFKKAIEENRQRKINDEKMERRRKQREEEGKKKSGARQNSMPSNDDNGRIIDRLLGNIKNGYISGDESTISSPRNSQTSPRTSLSDLDLGSDRPAFKRHTWLRNSDEKAKSRPQSDEMEGIFDSSDTPLRRRRVISDDVTLIDYLAQSVDDRKQETSLLDRSASITRRRRRRPEDIITERERDVNQSASDNTIARGHRRWHSDVDKNLIVDINHGPPTASNPSENDEYEITSRQPKNSSLRDSGIDSPKTNSRPTSLESPITIPLIHQTPAQEKLEARKKRREERSRCRERPPSAPAVIESETVPEHNANIVTQLSEPTPDVSDTSVNESPPATYSKLPSGMDMADVDKILEAIENTKTKMSESAGQESPAKPTVLQYSRRRRTGQKTEPIASTYSDTAVSDKTSLLLQDDTQQTDQFDSTNVQTRFKHRWKSFLRQRSDGDNTPEEKPTLKEQIPRNESPPPVKTSPTSPIMTRRRSRRWLQQLAFSYADNTVSESPQTSMLGVDITAASSEVQVVAAERPSSLSLSTLHSQERIEEKKAVNLLRLESMESSPQFLRTPEEGVKRLLTPGTPVTPRSRSQSPLPLAVMSVYSDKISSNPASPSSPIGHYLRNDGICENANISLSTNELNSAQNSEGLGSAQSMTSLSSGSPGRDSGVSKLNRMLARLPIKRRNLGIRRSRSNADVDSIAAKSLKNQPSILGDQSISPETPDLSGSTPAIIKMTDSKSAVLASGKKQNFHFDDNLVSSSSIGLDLIVANKDTDRVDSHATASSMIWPHVDTSKEQMACQSSRTESVINDEVTGRKSPALALLSRFSRKHISEQNKIPDSPSSLSPPSTSKINSPLIKRSTQKSPNVNIVKSASSRRLPITSPSKGPVSERLANHRKPSVTSTTSIESINPRLANRRKSSGASTASLESNSRPRVSATQNVKPPSTRTIRQPTTSSPRKPSLPKSSDTSSQVKVLLAATTKRPSSTLDRSGSGSITRSSGDKSKLMVRRASTVRSNDGKFDISNGSHDPQSMKPTTKGDNSLSPQGARSVSTGKGHTYESINGPLNGQTPTPARPLQSSLLTSPKTNIIVRNNAPTSNISPPVPKRQSSIGMTNTGRRSSIPQNVEKAPPVPKRTSSTLSPTRHVTNSPSTSPRAKLQTGIKQPAASARNNASADYSPYPSVSKSKTVFDRLSTPFERNSKSRLSFRAETVTIRSAKPVGPPVPGLSMKTSLRPKSNTPS